MPPVQLEFGAEFHCQLSVQELVGDDDEVYEATGGPGSTDDIWKKFELIPTPPLSPSRQTATSGASSPTCLTESPADTLQCVSDVLDIDSCRSSFAENSCSNLTSKLIQDCMWGSHSRQEKVQRVRIADGVYDTPCSTPPPFFALDYISADCVDPSFVFSYPINNQDITNSESSSDDEIDVVSVEKAEKPVKRKCPVPSANNVEAKTLRHEPVAKKPRTYQKRSRDSINKETKDRPSEPIRDVTNRLASKDKLEDPECKRNVHNVLERKRRNDLKYSFQVLRDSIPDLKGSERAPKVAILRKATDCILNLRCEQESLLEEKQRLEETHQSLVRKLKLLKESP